MKVTKQLVNHRRGQLAHSGPCRLWFFLPLPSIMFALAGDFCLNLIYSVTTSRYSLTWSACLMVLGGCLLHWLPWKHYCGHLKYFHLIFENVIFFLLLEVDFFHISWLWFSLTLLPLIPLHLPFHPDSPQFCFSLGRNNEVKYNKKKPKTNTSE